MLSGGRRRRIVLAGALLKDDPAIMPDEATYAPDNETQAAIRDAIGSMDGWRTVIMFAHRLSTVVNCRRPFHIEDGKVLAPGTHDECLKTCEPHRRMYTGEAAVSRSGKPEDFFLQKARQYGIMQVRNKTDGRRRKAAKETR